MEFEKRQRIREWVGKRVDEGMFERDIVDALVEQGVPEEDAIRETLFVMKIRESKEQNKDVYSKAEKEQRPIEYGNRGRGVHSWVDPYHCGRGRSGVCGSDRDWIDCVFYWDLPKRDA